MDKDEAKQLHTDTKVTIGLLVPLIGALVAGLTYIIADHTAIADLQQKVSRVESIAIDIAVIKQKVIDLNDKIDRQEKDFNGR